MKSLFLLRSFRLPFELEAFDLGSTTCEKSRYRSLA
jgi:hypothetical protein